MFYSTLKRIMMLGASTVLASTFALGSAMVPAFAEPVVVTGKRVIDPDLPTKVVEYGDLNITTQTGQKLLLRRVDRAVRDLCEIGFGYEHYLETRSCRSFAWGGARPQIASALARARMGQVAALSASIPVSAK